MATRPSLAVLLATTALHAVPAFAVDGTWTGTGGTPGEWTDGTNWTSTPNVPDGTATLAGAAPPAIQNNAQVHVGTVNFTGVSAYDITVNDLFFLNGAGLTNNSTTSQTFDNFSAMLFQNNSSASVGSAAVTINNNGGLVFQNASTAGTAVITNNSEVDLHATSTAGTATITNNASLNFFDSSSAASAHITNSAGGTMTFLDTSTAGGATLGNAGILNFTASSSAGSAGITNTATGGSLGLFFSNSSSAGTSTITNSGAVAFHDLSTAGNAFITNITGASLGFFSSASAGGASITNAAGASVNFNDATSAGISLINSSGVVNFNTSATAGSATITNNNSGTVTFNNSATAGHATINNNNNAIVNFNDSATASNAQINNNGNGIVNFSNSASAGNAFIVNNNASFLNFNSSATASAAIISNNAGATTQFLDASSAGSATIFNATNGITQFFTTASAGNAIISNNGGLTQFNNSSTAGSATIATNSGGGVFFVGTSSGSQATFVTNSGGVFDMSGLTSAGTTAASIAGAGTYFLGAKTLTVGSNDLSTTVSGIISDGGLSGGIGGGLTKVGTGALTLSGINTFTGATTVNAGMLIVDGSTALSALTTVGPGATLAGSGIVGNTAIAGGILAPGSIGGSIFGPLTVQGNLSLTAASTYMIQVSPTNASRTNVSGTATLGGATVNANFATGTLKKQYTILTANGGVSGTFNPAVVVANMSTNVQSTLSYDAHDVFLNINLSFNPPGGSLNANQQSVANAITSLFNASGTIPMAFAGLNAAGLTIASGELGTGIIQSSVKANDLFLNLLLDPSVAGRAGGFAQPGSGALPITDDDDSSAYAGKRKASPSERDAFAMVTKAPPWSTAPGNRWSVWGATYGGSETVGGNAATGSQDTTGSVYGLVTGADYRPSPNSLIGFALAGGGTSFSLANRLGSGSADLFQAGAYARHDFGPAYLSGALAYGWHDVTTNRAVALAGLDLLQGRFRAESYSGRIEGGYRFATPLFGITPYAAAQVTGVSLPSYAEQSLTGGGLFALNYAARTTTDTRSELGLRGDKSFAMQDAVLTLRSRAAWAHDYDPDRAVTAIFQALPGANFVVNGARPAPDSALVSAGAEAKWLNGFSLAATFEGEFAGNVTSYAGKGIARYTW